MTPPQTARRIADRLLQRDPPPPLVPVSIYDSALAADIDAFAVPDAVKCGLHLLNDDLPRAHALAQRGEGDSVSDYWHAIIHRREGDYGNSRYWFRRVGPALLQARYGPDAEAPGAFVARCQAVGRGRDAELERFQVDEMAHLLLLSGLPGTDA